MTTPILIFSIVLVVTSVALALFVLLHKGRGGGLSDLFGGGISSSMGGSSVAERNLDRLDDHHRGDLAGLHRGARPALQARRLGLTAAGRRVARTSHNRTPQDVHGFITCTMCSLDKQ